MSVVIPFFNAESTLAACVEALLRQNAPPLELILVDNRSTDRSGNLARNLASERPQEIKYVFEERKGPSYARNTGAKEAQGDVVAFTDADCIADPNWVKNLVEAFRTQSIGAVAGKIFGFETISLLDKFHFLFTMQGPAVPTLFSEFTLTRGGFPTANLAVRRNVFQIIGGFDESMKIYSEDFDLCARIYKASFHIYYAPSAVIYHKHRKTLKGTWKQSFGFGLGHAALLKKHFKHMLIVDMPHCPYRSSAFPLRAWIDLYGADKKLFLLVLLSIFWWPLFLALPAYLIYLHCDMIRRFKKGNLKVSCMETFSLVFFLLYKSTALTCGRLAGGLINRVFCV